MREWNHTSFPLTRGFRHPIPHPLRMSVVNDCHDFSPRNVHPATLIFLTTIRPLEAWKSLAFDIMVRYGQVMYTCPFQTIYLYKQYATYIYICFMCVCVCVCECVYTQKADIPATGFYNTLPCYQRTLFSCACLPCYSFYTFVRRSAAY